MTWVAFACGCFIGAICGVIVISLLVVGRSGDDDMPQMGPPRLPR